MKRIVTLLALGIFTYFIYSHITGGDAQQMSGMPPGGAMPVSVATVISKEIIEWAEFSGRLEAVDRVEIRPRVGGEVEAVLFQDGQMVKAGQPLFTIDTRPYVADLKQAQAVLEAARSQASLAAMQLQRAEKTLEQKAISQREYDTRRNDAQTANAAIKTAEAMVRKAQLNLEYANITAPISGKISRAEITAGNLVKADANSPLLATIVSADPIYASFDADEKSFVKFTASSTQNGALETMQVELALAGENGFSRQGRMHSFDNELNASSGTVRARAIFSNADGALIPGLYAKVRVGTSGAQKAVLIHESAIGTEQTKKFVYVVKPDNSVEFREIQPGGMSSGLRVVESGLQEGETIIVNGLQRVHPGVVVIPQTVAMENPLQVPSPAATTPTVPVEK